LRSVSSSRIVLRVGSAKALKTSVTRSTICKSLLACQLAWTFTGHFVELTSPYVRSARRGGGTTSAGGRCVDAEARSARQPVASHGNGFRLISRFRRPPIRQRLPPVATARLHKRSIPVAGISDEKGIRGSGSHRAEGMTRSI
jgi:hypothetical protein